MAVLVVLAADGTAHPARLLPSADHLPLLWLYLHGTEVSSVVGRGEGGKLKAQKIAKPNFAIARSGKAEALIFSF